MIYPVDRGVLSSAQLMENFMLRRTKIVATVGPATDDLGVMTGMMREGVDVVRLNASHGTVEDRRRRLALVREAARISDRDRKSVV